MKLRACIIWSFLLLPVLAVHATNYDEMPSPVWNEEDNFGDSLVMLMAELMDEFPQFSDEDYKNRLRELSGVIEYRLDPIVKERILVRTEKYRESTERLLGRSDIYFPIFEEHLAKYNVPHHLKYLAIVESHLNPVAKSVASAVGLWQFIPSSGRLFGLKISSYVDERSDTYKASEAAARLLSTLYERYGDWALAMAAYNCGPGRVNGAIKRAGGSTDYWKVRNYLPRETQKYVPFFMAMVYVGEFHTLHKLKPQKMPQNLVLTDTIHLDGGISVHDLAEDLDISVDTLKFLNPAYRRNWIPKSKDGQIIVLPAQTVSQLRGYQNAFKRVLGLQKENPIRAVRRINNKRDLDWLAKAYRCTVEDLLAWNELPSNYRPYRGDLIAIRKYHAPKDLKKKHRHIEGISIAALKVVGLDESKKAKTSAVYLKSSQNSLPATTVAVAGGAPLRASAQHTTAAAQQPASSNQTNNSQQFAVPRASATKATNDDRSRARRFRNYGFVSANSETEEYDEGPKIESSYVEKEEVELVSIEGSGSFAEGAPLVKGRDLLMDGQQKKATTTSTPQSTTPKKEETVVAEKETNTPVNNSLIADEQKEVLNVQPVEETVADAISDRSRDRKLRNFALVPQPAEAAASASNTKISALQAAPSQEETTLGSKYRYHKVKAGETIWDVQAKFEGISAHEIMEENQLNKDESLRTGQVLKIRVK